MSDLLQPIVDAVVGLMGLLGGPGIAIAVALENLFPPIPSEVILPAAGFAAAQGQLGLVAAIVWATLGSVVGALALYGIGAAIGRDRLLAVVERMPFVKVADVEKAEAWFVKHGPKAVLVGRLVPIVRSLISVPAGLERMRLATFAAYTAVGSAIWNTLLVVAGYLLGNQWHLVEVWIERYQYGVIAAAVLACAAYVAVRIASARQAVPVPVSARTRHDG